MYGNVQCSMNNAGAFMYNYNDKIVLYSISIYKAQLRPHHINVTSNIIGYHRLQCIYSYRVFQKCLNRTAKITLAACRLLLLWESQSGGATHSAVQALMKHSVQIIL